MKSDSMKFENIDTYNWLNAVRGMRNPVRSWEEMDSYYNEDSEFVMGEGDHKLAMKLVKRGSDHRKFMRQIFVSVDITAPWYWWKEYETYEIGTEENSTSMMHTAAERKYTKDDFAWDYMTNYRHYFLEHINSLVDTIWELEDEIEELANKLESIDDSGRIVGIKGEISDLKNLKNKKWRQLNQDMSGSYLYKRTCTLNYEVLRRIYQARCAIPHKLNEWAVDFKDFAKNLPYSKLITKSFQ